MQFPRNIFHVEALNNPYPLKNYFATVNLLLRTSQQPFFFVRALQLNHIIHFFSGSLVFY